MICDGLLLDGIKGPEGIKVLASMVPPFGVTMSYFLAKLFHKNIYTKKEVENIEVAFPMGCCMITEGVIPIAMNDLLRTLPCTWIGCGITGMIEPAETDMLKGLDSLTSLKLGKDNIIKSSGLNTKGTWNLNGKNLTSDEFASQLIKSAGNAKYTLDFKSNHPTLTGNSSLDITYENLILKSTDYYGVADTYNMTKGQTAKITFRNIDFYGSQLIDLTNMFSRYTVLYSLKTTGVC